MTNQNAYKHEIAKCVEQFVHTYQERPDISTKWGAPLVGFADAHHPYIQNLKAIISPMHKLPQDVMADATVVIAYFVPFTKELAKSNAEYTRLASPEWALAYEQTNTMFGELNQAIIRYIEHQGFRAAVSPETKTFDQKRLMSNWSHRHFAYAAGLGTFGMNNMLITRKGCCGRYFTVVTNLPIQPDEPLEEELCLYKKNKSCGVCFKNCPVKALTPEAYDRHMCYRMLRENAQGYQEFGNSYQDETGEHANSVGSEVCGKCVTASPCMFWNK